MPQQKEYDEISHRIAFATELHLAGVKDQDLLNQLYVQFLPGAKEEEGLRMAHDLLEQIRMFDVAQARFMELDGQWNLLGEYIVHLMDGFTMSSQCRKLHSISQAMDALSELCKGTHTLEEIVQRTQPGYRGNTGGKGRNTELQVVLEKLFTPLGERKREGLPADARQTWMDDTMFRAVLTMAVFTSVAKEENPLNLPLPLEYITLEVCCLHSALDGQKRKESGKEAELRHSVDSAAVKLFLTSGFLAGGTGSVLFSGSSVGIYSAYYLAVLAAKRFLLV